MDGWMKGLEGQLKGGGGSAGRDSLRGERSEVLVGREEGEGERATTFEARATARDVPPPHHSLSQLDIRRVRCC